MSRASDEGGDDFIARVAPRSWNTGALKQTPSLGPSIARAVKAGRRPPAGEALTARSGAVQDNGCRVPPGTRWSPLPARLVKVEARCGLLQGQTMLAGTPGDPGAGHLFATARWHGVLRPQLDGFNQMLGLDDGP